MTHANNAEYPTLAASAIEGNGPASDLIRSAAALYDAYEMDALPRALRRNSLDYYYLSVYPSLSEMRPFAEDAYPPYPDAIHTIYIHVPFCSGICEFCSYYLIAINKSAQERVARYLDIVLREMAYHATRTKLDITYLYFGGGTPSLVPPDALARLLERMAIQGWLSPQAMGTLELHPELFGDRERAEALLDVLGQYGLQRVSVGYQVSDELLLSATKRRHHADFIAGAMDLLRGKGFAINLDLMYGLPGQSLASWETTLRDAVALAPDSLSTYFLFVDQGTVMFNKVKRGLITLPDHRHAQTQHLMAQLYLEQHGYWELPNDFWARGITAGDTFRPERLPSASATLPIGPGAYGYYGNTQLANVFDLAAYEQQVLSGKSPLWRGHALSLAEAFHRDVMFALKNDPFLNCRLFVSHYNRDPREVFRQLFERLAILGLVAIDGSHIRLTRKGRLCVEEISSLFRHPDIRPSSGEPETTQALLQRHNFAPTYPPVMW